MKKYFLVAFMVIACKMVCAQCNCEENFEFVYAKIKINYAGWQDKTQADPTAFEKFTSQQREKAQTETQKNYCYKIIHDWLNYFQDHHTHLYTTAGINLEGKTDAEIREHFALNERINLTEASAIETLARAQGVEGIWQMEGGNYRVAIIRNETTHRTFAAIVLKADSVYWMPGQLKFELTNEGPVNFDAMFYMRDHSMRLVKATLDHQELRFEGLNSFRKIYPGGQSRILHESAEVRSRNLEFKKLNASTVYFRIPSFNHTLKNQVDSIIQIHHDLITETRNLILDVRDNGGGSDVTYSELIQYIYTNKIVLVNNSIWSSEDNIQKFKNILSDPDYPESGKGYIRTLVKRLEANPQTFIRKEDNVIRKIRSLPDPKRVVILINRGCASSCEEFVLAARQSKKVTLMGENTMGVLDYANVHTLTLPCSVWGLQYATSRTNRLPDFPIDNIGIEPAVKIPEGKNGVEFAVEYLKRN